jgi:hypothetical protein
MIDYLAQTFYVLVILNVNQQHVNKYSMLQHKLNLVHSHRHAMQLELMLQQLVFDEKNVFDVVFVELLMQNQNQGFPRKT